jgi:predicted RNase H-like HicB family nuclease
MWLVSTDSFPGYWGNGKTLAEAVANARSAGGRAPWVATRFEEGWINPRTDGLTISAEYVGDDPSRVGPEVAERFSISRGGTIKGR